ncbi:hypothetical protein GYB62_02785 [bacterium]|nr:hypothetical protein [bacterium]
MFAGANAILHKPIDEEELINTLLQTLQREQRVPNQSSILPDTPEDRKRWISELQRLCDNIEANYAGIFEHGNAELPTAITQALHDLRGIVSLHNNAPLTASAERLAQAIKGRKRQAVEDEIRAFNDLLKAQRQALLQ